ncbi:Swt1 family HEPN domain-containing protein [Burkholderia sp. L27(2015)]|uniref:Swt1 family HEPN domain-containing protein n=1 Tax=Burkholderia sp. L27(2015) TaxID=1641858 RepID=UPI00131A98FD|nr:Swt1 family HEPN domain-containing protein [Burkholderia sp. L27(2015)]
MPFRNMSTDEMRNLVRHQIETLERWLRRLIDDVLRAHHGGSLSALPIKKDIVTKAAERRSQEPPRYPREVDALLFDDLVTIICHPQMYGHFQDSLKDAFPDGAPEARTFLDRIVEARNPLAHTNDITTHQALRVACYSADVIESLKAYYARNNLAQTYNAPSFLRVWDSLGNSGQVEESQNCSFHFDNTPLRPGDTLQLEVQLDESFAEDSYRIEWAVCNVPQGERGLGRRFSLTLKDQHVTQNGLPIRATIIADRSWHKHGTYDAMLHIRYPVLPPI